MNALGQAWPPVGPFSFGRPALFLRPMRFGEALKARLSGLGAVEPQQVSKRGQMVALGILAGVLLVGGALRAAMGWYIGKKAHGGKHGWFWGGLFGGPIVSAGYAAYRGTGSASPNRKRRRRRHGKRR
jgi:hypothetical protein